MAGIPRTLPEVLRRAIEGALADCHVAVPGQVKAYSALTNLADVAVQVQHSVWDDDNNRSYEDVGTLPGVPVMWPRAGGQLLTMPLAVGDTGLLIFNSDAIGEWRATNQSSQPADSSRMSVGWPVFIPGLFADMNQFAAGDAVARAAGLLMGVDGGTQQILIPTIGGTVDIGKGATLFAAYGDTNDVDWAAAKVMATALNAFATALSSYASAIQGVADPTPPHTPTTTLATACTAMSTACTVFSAAVLPTKATIARVK